MFTAWITLKFKFAEHFSRFSKLIFSQCFQSETVPTGTLRNPEFCFQHNKPAQSEKTQTAPNLEEAPVPPEETRGFASFAYQFDCDGLCRKIHLFLFGQFRIVSLTPAPLPSSSLTDCLLSMIILGCWNRPKSTVGPGPSSNKPALTTLNLF